jgi:hypothetical protein
MASNQEATARQLDFTYDEQSASAPRPATGDRVERHHRLCDICGRGEAHLTIPGRVGHPAAAVCLRCHHAVRQQRRMLRVTGSSAGHTYDELAHRRHRAQIRARKALGE